MELVRERYYQGEEKVSEIMMVNHHTEIVGGGELSMLQLMDGLKANGKAVSLITSGSGELAERARENGHSVFMIPMPPIGMASLKAFGEWHNKLKNLGGGVLHAQTPRAAFYAGVAGRRASVPSIFHCRVAARDWKLDPILVRLVSRVICNSQATAARFSRWQWLKPEVIYNGLDVDVDTVVFEHDKSEKMNLMFVGRLSEEKQPEVAWKVFSRLADRFPKLNLIYVGGDDLLNPSLAEDLRKKIYNSQWQNRVEWAGPQQDVSPWYGKADLVLMPSKYEGFGRVLVEAMAHKVPVVAFRVGAIPEVVENGKQGVLVGLNDLDAMTEAVVDLLENENKRMAMGFAGTERADCFSLSSHVELVSKVYRSFSEGRYGH